MSQAFNLAAPEVLTWDNTGGYDGGIIPEQTPDMITVGVRDNLNQQYPYPPTVPPQFPAYVRAMDNGPGDETYTVSGLYDPMFSGRYGAMNYDPMFQPMIVRHEAPEIPYNHLAWHQLIADSAISMNQGVPGGQLVTSYRAPLINEGL